MNDDYMIRRGDVLMMLTDGECYAISDIWSTIRALPVVQPDAVAIKSASFEIAGLMEIHAAIGTTIKFRAYEIEKVIRALIDTGKETE